MDTVRSRLGQLARRLTARGDFAELRNVERLLTEAVVGGKASADAILAIGGMRDVWEAAMALREARKSAGKLPHIGVFWKNERPIFYFGAPDIVGRYPKRVELSASAMFDNVREIVGKVPEEALDHFFVRSAGGKLFHMASDNEKRIRWIPAPWQGTPSNKVILVGATHGGSGTGSSCAVSRGWSVVNVDGAQLARYLLADPDFCEHFKQCEHIGLQACHLGDESFMKSFTAELGKVRHGVEVSGPVYAVKLHPAAGVQKSGKQGVEVYAVPGLSGHDPGTASYREWRIMFLNQPPEKYFVTMTT